MLWGVPENEIKASINWLHTNVSMSIKGRS